MIKGRRIGDIARQVADDIRTERRFMLGLDTPYNPMSLPGVSPEEKRKRRLEGGIVIVGRHTLKEYMHGLKRGWTDGLEPVDREEQLARALEDDGKFDEVDAEEPAVNVGDGEPIPTPSRLPASAPLSILANQKLRAPPSPSSGAPAVPEPNAPPAVIPPQPPMLLVSFTNYIGFKQIPLMIWDFFNERHKALAGAEAAMKLIMGATRPFSAPHAEAFARTESWGDLEQPQKPLLAELSPSDLDFDRAAEAYYKKSTVRDFESEMESARKEYYKGLAKKLETARALARGAREPTKEELNNPPPTEVELRAERLKKELRWRSDEDGFSIIRPEKDVEWDERFRGVLRVYVDARRSDSGTPPS